MAEMADITCRLSQCSCKSTRRSPEGQKSSPRTSVTLWYSLGIHSLWIRGGRLIRSLYSSFLALKSHCTKGFFMIHDEARSSRACEPRCDYAPCQGFSHYAICDTNTVPVSLLGLAFMIHTFHLSVLLQFKPGRAQDF
jgi:hypothetical protein